MQNLVKFIAIKNMNDRFRNFVTSFQENEKVMSQKFKNAKILNEEGNLDKDLNLAAPINASETNPRPRLSRHLTQIESPTGSKSARNKTEIEPIFDHTEFASEGDAPIRQKALSEDKNDSFNGLSEEEVEPQLEIT
jgi:hypothetical protein